ncbi:SDR family NAD(P)-dependent oxidoreductase [Erythrobacter sp.]|uniref:SDR family NAD(P)-dependent oxidoreductase n=1 Tax=Erythrobacter sp. TaxID=1042 RepID=UPI001B04B835|nr:SDR family NAD(P)-dependent oxidoreductase [Erythrobacter sp.]MBO6526148.1 SDR family NAD(P)-dependent oxidoreductase [Erythrobacter sp.]MBO6530401.1 SDR family NAD(P)-dependent oxidoreductase [Erythrobacter sp.]
MDVGKTFRRAAIFGASGGIGRALAKAVAHRGAQVWAGSRSCVETQDCTRAFRFDLADEDSIAAAADTMRDAPPDLVIVASGVLTLENGAGPERAARQIDGTAMEQVFRLNTIGPALIAKHMLPLLPRDRRSVFAALSARVGSISDNGLGGWHSYRASKAALNMLLKNYAIELARTHKQAVVAGLHPGTVDTMLSQPFQSNLPEGQLTAPHEAADNLLAVIDGLEPADSGKVFDWQGEEIPA